MFLAWNEIKRNKLKFGLIIGILVLLISYLLLPSVVSKWFN